MSRMTTTITNQCRSVISGQPDKEEEPTYQPCMKRAKPAIALSASPTSTSAPFCDSTEGCSCIACYILGPATGPCESLSFMDLLAPESPSLLSTEPALTRTDCLLNSQLVVAGGGMPMINTVKSSWTSFMASSGGVSSYSCLIDTPFGSSQKEDLATLWAKPSTSQATRLRGSGMTPPSSPQDR